MSDDEIVIYDRGKEVEKRLNPMLLQIIMLDDIQVALSKLNQHFKKEEFEGYEFFRTLPVTDQIQSITLIGDWPFAPLISAYFFNKGEQKAYIQVNYPGEWFELEKGESAQISHAGANRRIEIIYYKCDDGETASVSVLGKY